MPSNAWKDGKLTAWSNSIVGQSFFLGTPFEAMTVKDGIDAVMVEGAAELPYEIADFACEVHVPKVGVPTLWWRSVGHTHTAYAVEAFVDELDRLVKDATVRGVTLKDLRVAALLNDVLAACRRHRIRLEANFATTVVAIAVVGVRRSGVMRRGRLRCEAESEGGDDARARRSAESERFRRSDY